jgi:hypothetical protein
MKKKNPAAQALGRLAKGVPKTISEAERRRRADRLRAAAQAYNARRAAGHVIHPPRGPNKAKAIASMKEKCGWPMERIFNVI